MGGNSFTRKAVFRGMATERFLGALASMKDTRCGLKYLKQLSGIGLMHLPSSSSCAHFSHSLD